MTKSEEERVYTNFDAEMEERFGTFNSTNCGPADFARALCDCHGDKTFFFGYPCAIPPENPEHKNPAKTARQKALSESHDIAFDFMKGFLEKCGLHIAFICNTNPLSDYKKLLKKPANEAERKTQDALEGLKGVHSVTKQHNNSNIMVCEHCFDWAKSVSEMNIVQNGSYTVYDVARNDFLRQKLANEATETPIHMVSLQRTIKPGYVLACLELVDMIPHNPNCKVSVHATGPLLGVFSVVVPFTPSTRA
jgi:hypothetical protein